MNEKNIIDKINKKFKVKENIQKKARIWIKVNNKELIDLCNYANSLGFEHLSAISVTDLINKGKYELVYFTWSYHDKIMLIIKTEIERKKPMIPSVIEIWKENAQIHERELHELFGVKFKGNPDLSELFLEGWKQEPPFKKDFDWRKYVREKYYNKKGREKVYFEEKL